MIEQLYKNVIYFAIQTQIVMLDFDLSNLIFYFIPEDLEFRILTICTTQRIASYFYLRNIHIQFRFVISIQRKIFAQIHAMFGKRAGSKTNQTRSTLRG